MVAMLLCCTLVARAQSITGRVLDQQGNAIEFANVVLLSKADSTALAGTITDSTGAFSLQSSAAMANTCLRLSFVGYKPQTLCEVQPDMGSNKPLWMAQVNNTIYLPWDMKLNANLTYQGSGNTQNIMTKSMIFADIWLSKYFLKKAATPERGHRRHHPRTKRVLGAQHERPQNNKESKARFALRVCEP